MTRSMLSLALLSSLAGAAAAQPPTPPTPAEVTTVLDRMVGTWTSNDVAVQIKGEQKKASGRVTCQKAAGAGVQCRVQATMPGMREEETNLIGWDPVDGKVHLFAVNSRYTHDHVGTVQGDVLKLEFSATRDGKPYLEQLSFTFKGPKEVVWKDSCTLGGQVVFAGEGTYRK
jgi:hypothetical protein